ncbi:MAG: LicD family protein [Clostridium sp.]|nr:LicD family protein [Clostridium sp.]
MNEVQNKLYQIITKFDELCKKHNIIYYLGGGSALGALRHKGFLPWDDDVDLYITRENYEKLLSVQNDFFDDDFVLVNTENFPRYRNTLVRCVDTHSTAITKARIVDQSAKGQFVELFILDPIPKDKDAQEKWFVKHWIYAELLSVAFRVANNRISRYIDEDLYNEYKSRCKEIGYDAVLKELENELFTIEEKDADEYCSRWGLRNLIYKIEWFQEPRYVPFEDTLLPVATYAENVARFDYGDQWMYIPRVDEQVTHSFAESMHIPYKYFVDDYLNFIDAEAIYQAYAARKDNLVNLYLETSKSKNKKAELKKIEVKLSLEYNKDPDLEKKLNDGNFDEVAVFFSTWYENQFNSLFLQSGIYLSIEDDMLYMALVPLLVRGDYSLVRKMILLRANEGDLSPKLQTLLDFTDAIRNVYIAIDNHDHALAKENLNKAHNIDFRFADSQFNLKILDLKYKIDEVQSGDEQYDDLLNEVKEFLNQYENNGEIMYLAAEIYYRKGDKKSALEWYNLAYDNTRHGFVRMHIDQRKHLLESEEK